ncbi:MAG TPA: o-succinylbenzoate synthase, partial [Acidimicrobiales bacterium]|nr:o-succinylbenzoate synthase [Acidimicrobiales bacterium]
STPPPSTSTRRLRPAPERAPEGSVIVEAVELRRLSLPLVTPFRTAAGTHAGKDVLLVRVLGPDGEGWGECGALEEPTYTSEYVAGAELVLRLHLVPRLLAAPGVSAGRLAVALAPVKGHRMAKAALEMALLDAELRAAGRSLATALGGVRDSVDAGVAVGIHPSIAELVGAVEGYVAAGYRRVKLKIEPGWDVEPLAAVRAAVGPEVGLMADANGSYSAPTAADLCRVDDLGLLCLEQPLHPRDLAGHAALARRMRTPICLDESVESAADAAEALDMGACAVVNIKAARCGGYLEAVRVHDACVARGAPVWCGGMLETGLGRAANVALAALPGFTMPGDLSASDRWFAEDLTEPFVLRDGRLAVPTGPGLGVTPLPDVLRARTTTCEVVRR